MNVKSKFAAMALAAFSVTGIASAANVDVTVNPAANWIGFMAVTDLPADGGAFQFASPWGVPDLDAGFVGANAFVTPNTNIARNVPLTDAFWWKPNGSPNKQMTASYFVESTSIAAGDTITFAGNVLSNSLVAPYTSVAFIKELDPNNNFALVNITTVPLTPGNFSITQPVVFGLLVQYGFETVGPQSTISDQALSQATFGKAVIGAIPEPTMLGLAGAFVPVLARRRRA